MDVKYQRILLKLSGEALVNEENIGISAAAINNYVAEITAIHKLGVQIGIVIGGGNFYRGINEKDTGIKKMSGDKMGMLATIMNGLALKDVFEVFGIKSKVLSAIYLPQFAEVFRRGKAINYLKKNIICIFAGGTGNPLFTTDSAAALRAIEIEADLLIKATNVDGVYNADPQKDKNAVMFNKISFEECIEKNLQVMDRTAFVLCKENNMPIIVTNVRTNGNLLKVVRGENIGTRIE